MKAARKGLLNAEIIGSNLAEANEQLAELLQQILTGGMNEAELQIGILHAHHHLNFAWNIRHVSTSEYAKLTDAQFEEWGKYPSDIDIT